ncbi:MAG: hypothetical protein M1823_007489, partial [Watsoniomyces obsoletus]
MWAMKSVIDWLARNGYSSEWQAAFQNLRLDGNNFLQLGIPRSGMLALHSQIYPEMQRLCLERRKSWDWDQVRTEGRRLRKLITAIVQNTDLSPGPGYKRRDDDSYGLPALTNENGSVLPDEPDEMSQVRTTRPGSPPPTRQALPNTAQPRRDQPAQKANLDAAGHVDNYAYRDYQMQLMLLEQQSKKRLA